MNKDNKADRSTSPEESAAAFFDSVEGIFASAREIQRNRPKLSLRLSAGETLVLQVGKSLIDHDISLSGKSRTGSPRVAVDDEETYEITLKARFRGEIDSPASHYEIRTTYSKDLGTYKDRTRTYEVSRNSITKNSFQSPDRKELLALESAIDEVEDALEEAKETTALKA